ncbi:MAG: rRNA maturation RNase YbeY [Candidatus Staskawiczbacteria bacterium]|nr:rRNA maturation RNase YbeY [Candidatus Staskawiczbacteria bacterium]
MIEINNKTKGYPLSPVDKKVFSTVAKKVLKGENRGTETVSLAFVGKEEIKKLNKEFRKKNKATDVLSFELNDAGCLGEIVICPEVVKGNAEKYKISEQEEMLKVFVHGILHLCGYDHEKSEKEAELMESKQEKYLSKA